MEQLPKYVSSSPPNYVCKLKKFLYGLKQVPMAWYDNIVKYLHHFCGYFAFNWNSSLFVKKQHGVHDIVFLFVDDMILTLNDNREVANLDAEPSI